jgi:alkylation response protein AidB-like acyl-CoA dehydrogenase
VNESVVREREERVAEVYRPRGDDFLPLEELRALSPRTVVERCRALKPALRAHALEAERLRRPIDRLWDEIRRSGYFYLLVPREWGGLEASVDEVCDATMALAEGCGSTGWVASFGMMHNRHLVHASPELQEEIFGGGRYCIYASGTMPPGRAVRVAGGWRVSGRWKWATCSTNADWFSAVVNFETPEGVRTGTVMIPADDVTVLDTWHADGMRATGTHDFEAVDVFVPDHRAELALKNRDGSGPGAERYPNPIYRVPLSPLLTFTVLMVVVGLARSAVEVHLERMESHTKRGVQTRQADSQASQIRLAKADTMVSTADMLCRQTMYENLRGTELRGDAQVPFRSRLRAQMAYAAELCRNAVLMVCEANGTSIHYLDHPLQRILRDTMVATSHIVFDHDVVFEQHGRGMLGLPPTSTIA